MNVAWVMVIARAGRWLPNNHFKTNSFFVQLKHLKSTFSFGSLLARAYSTLDVLVHIQSTFLVYLMVIVRLPLEVLVPKTAPIA